MRRILYIILKKWRQIIILEVSFEKPHRNSASPLSNYSEFHIDILFTKFNQSCHIPFNEKFCTYQKKTFGVVSQSIQNILNRRGKPGQV